MAKRRDLKQAIQQYLETQGLRDIATDAANIVWNHVLSWRVDTDGELDDAEYIFAFSFGFQWDTTRRRPNGNRKPGTVNEQLADRVVEYYNAKKRPVYAQWEVYAAIGERISDEHLRPVLPDIDEKDTSSPVKYLGTRDVLKKIRKKIRKELGDRSPKVLIVAHYDHLLRCVRLAKECGFNNLVTAQCNMPNTYVRKSGQAWTKNRRREFVSEIISRLVAYRKEKLYTEKP